MSCNTSAFSAKDLFSWPRCEHIHTRCDQKVPWLWLQKAVFFEVVTQLSAHHSSSWLRLMFSLRPLDTSKRYSRTWHWQSDPRECTNDLSCGPLTFRCSIMTTRTLTACGKRVSFQHNCHSPPPLLAGAGSLRPLYLPQEEVQAEGSPFRHSGGDPKHIAD